MGWMMRIRMPNGVLTSAQVRLLGEITRQSGRNIADVTTRQRIQLRWLTIEGVIRGIVGCPATGLTPKELVDTAPIAAAFQRIFLGNREFTNLPRKFNVTITGCPDNCTAAETQDVAMTPAVDSSGASDAPREVAGFNLAVGGKQGTRCPSGTRSSKCKRRRGTWTRTTPMPRSSPSPATGVSK